MKTDEYLANLNTQTLSHPLVYCEKHPHKAVKKYCPTHKSLHCNPCVFDHHIDHAMEQKSIVKESVTNFMKKSFTKLCKIVDEI